MIRKIVFIVSMLFCSTASCANGLDNTIKIGEEVKGNTKRYIYVSSWKWANDPTAIRKEIERIVTYYGYPKIDALEQYFDTNSGLVTTTMLFSVQN